METLDRTKSGLYNLGVFKDSRRIARPAEETTIIYRFCCARTERQYAFLCSKGEDETVMKKYFAMRASSVAAVQVTALQIALYRERLINEMKAMGASDQELLMIHDATIKNSIINKREPRDVAWAILQ